MAEFRLLIRHLGRFRLVALAEAVAVGLETALELSIPLLMAGIIDEGIATGDIGYIARQGALMLLCALLALGLGLAHARLISILANGLGSSLRLAEYERVQDFAFENLDRYQTSSLVTRLTTDITVIQNAVTNGFRPLVRSPLMLILGLFYACTLNRELAGVFLCTLPVLGIALFLIVKRTAPRYLTLQMATDDLNGVVRENLTAMRAVKAYVREDHRCQVFGRVNSELSDRGIDTFSSAVLNHPVLQASLYTTAVLVLWFGGQMILAGTLHVGELTGFMSYLLQIMNSLMMISNVFLQLTRALTSARRIAEVLEEEPKIEGPADSIAMKAVPDGSVSFSHVNFRYSEGAEQDVLNDISFSIPSGSTVGILGGTGSGKSSLVQLIARLYDADAGVVSVGGCDVRSYDLAVLRDAVGIALQKNVLFTGTVRDNLRWGAPDASDAELLRACELACADEFLDRIGGLDGDVGQGGDRVSGGQKQRLCIARTLLKHPRVLIFDDSTSAVDMATEATIRRNLASIKDATTIIIAQRITSVMEADCIYVLDDGRVHGCGTHAELLERDNIYQEIYASQMEFAKADQGLRESEGEAVKHA